MPKLAIEEKERIIEAANELDQMGEEMQNVVGLMAELLKAVNKGKEQKDEETH